MMKTKLLILFLSISLYGFSQEFKGKAIYKRYSNAFSIKTQNKAGEIIESFKENKDLRNTYTLNFNKSESSYKKNTVLERPTVQTSSGATFKTISGGDNIITYKNIKQNKIQRNSEFQGKRFFINDKLPKYNWELTGSSKKIGNYLCYEAIHKQKVVEVQIKGKNGKETITRKNKENITTVWYTPDIPVSNGPLNYWGLPGLILQVSDGYSAYLCVEIILNPSEEIEINKPPKRGEFVSLKEFRDMMNKKMLQNSRRRESTSYSVSYNEIIE